METSVWTFFGGFRSDYYGAEDLGVQGVQV